MRLIKKNWPLLLIVTVWIVLFFPFIFQQLIPFPADIITGIYYPWLDYKWGFSVGVPVKNPLMSDLPSILYPWRSLVVDQLKSFSWPLWNPYYFTGMPLLANFQSAVFSYVNVFFLFLPKALAWSCGVALSPLLTLLFMYLFLSRQGLNKTASLLGSVIFSLSGFEIAWLQYNVHGHTAMFLPLVLLAIDGILKGSKRKNFWLFLLPFLVAGQIFAGYIPLVIYCYLICFFYVLYFYVSEEVKHKTLKLKKYLLLFFSWLGGILLSLVQLVPGWELTKYSVRLIDPTVSGSNASYLPLKNLFTFLAPDFFGNPATGNYFGQAFYDNFYLFAGTGTIILVLFSLFFLKENKKIIFWIFLLATSFVLIFKNPFGQFIERMFFLSGGVSARALFITDFSLAVLGAFGAQKFIEGNDKKRKRIIFPIIIVFVLLVIAFGYSRQIENLVSQRVAQRNLIIPAFFFVLFSVLLIGDLLRKKIPLLSKKNELVIFFLVILTSVQLLYSGRKYLPFSKKELLFPGTPVIEFLLNEKENSPALFRTELGEVVPQNFLMPYGLYTSSGYDALLPRRTGEFFSLLQTGEIDKNISRVQLVRNYNSPLFPLLSTKYILAKKTDEKGIFSPEGHPLPMFLDERFKLVFEDKTVQVYEDRNFLAPAFWVYQVKVVKEKDDFVSLVKQNFDFSQNVVLEKDFPVSTLKKPLISNISWLENTPGKIVLETESDQPGFVFLSNNYFPGWQAHINDKKTEIFRANYTFMAVYAPAGKNLLTFEYRPRSFYWGLGLSLFFLANWFFVLFLFLFKKLWLKRPLF